MRACSRQIHRVLGAGSARVFDHGVFPRLGIADRSDESLRVERSRWGTWVRARPKRRSLPQISELLVQGIQIKSAAADRGAATTSCAAGVVTASRNPDAHAPDSRFWCRRPESARWKKAAASRCRNQQSSMRGPHGLTLRWTRRSCVRRSRALHDGSSPMRLSDHRRDEPAE